MVAHLHQKASYQLAWLEYDVQFRMEIAASPDRSWSCGDPWQYLSCLPSDHPSNDPFDVSEQEPEGRYKGKGKRPLEQEGEKGNPPAKQLFKKAKKEVCRLHNTAPNGCPYGKDCIFTHRCTSCGATDEHGRIACPDSPANPAWAPTDYTSAPATRR